MGKGKKSRKRRIAGITIIVFIALFITFCLFLSWFTDSDYFVMGTAGYVRQSIWRSLVAAIAIGVAVYCIRRLTRHGKRMRKIVGSCVGIFLCSMATIWMIRPIILDYPYLSAPAQTYLVNASVDYDATGDGATRYYLRGEDAEGNPHRFRITRELYDKGYDLWTDDPYAFSVLVVYLPNTDITIKVTFD